MLAGGRIGRLRSIAPTSFKSRSDGSDDPGPEQRGKYETQGEPPQPGSQCNLTHRPISTPRVACSRPVCSISMR